MEFRTRKFVKPGDLNARNTLFGGRALEWLDEECGIYAACQLNTTSIVTKIMGEANFLASAKQGDIIEIGVEVIAIGRTSITLRAEMRNKNTQEIIIHMDKVVMVCVDSDGRAIPHNCT